MGAGVLLLRVGVMYLLRGGATFLLRGDGVDALRRGGEGVGTGDGARAGRRGPGFGMPSQLTPYSFMVRSKDHSVYEGASKFQ